eukprot:8891425-Alexandrium_andersonii.AAC.1
MPAGCATPSAPNGRRCERLRSRRQWPRNATAPEQPCSRGARASMPLPSPSHHASKTLARPRRRPLQAGWWSD